MKKERSIHKRHWHCVFHLKYHLVLVTKYRKKCLHDKMLDRLSVLCEHVCKKWDVELVEFGGEQDHVHLLLDMHPNVALSRFVNNLKTVTSRLLRKEFAHDLARFYYNPVLWKSILYYKRRRSSFIRIEGLYTKTRKSLT